MSAGSNKENIPAQSTAPTRKRAREESEEAANVFKNSRSDPLVHYGRHWGRTVSTFCPIFGLVRDGMERKQRLGDDLEAYEDQVDAREARDHRLYRQLFLLVPKLEERLGQSSDEEIHYICNMLTRGVNSARSDDTKSLKAALVDWITPPGGVLTPPIQRNVKTDRGFHHPRTGELLCPPHWDWNDPKIREGLKSGELVPSGVHFPVFLYQDFKYPGDAKVWDGLFKSRLLVNAYKHVFTSPSSVGEKGSSRATRSSNARIHGMKSVTIPSIAYIATQVRFALHSQSTFLRTDLVTDSEYFYDSVVALLEDMKERQEVNELLTWWNLQIFPSYVNGGAPGRDVTHSDTVVSKIQERRRRIELEKAASVATTSSSVA